MVLIMFDYENVKISRIARYITIEYCKKLGDVLSGEILLVFVNNYDGYDLLPNRFDEKDIDIIGIDDV